MSGPVGSVQGVTVPDSKPPLRSVGWAVVRVRWVWEEKGGERLTAACTACGL